MIRFMRNLLSSLATLLLSLMLAILIWITATQTEDPTISKSLQVPLEFINQPSETTLVSPTAANRAVLLTVQGRASVLSDINRDDFTATVDLNGVSFAEDQLVDVVVQQLNAQVNIVSQSPPQVTVRMEELVSADIPVEAEIRGSVARGYSRGQASIDPAAIAVVGTASEVESLDFALVTINLTGDERETIVAERQPIFYDKQGQIASVRNLDVSARNVVVTIPINESADFAEKIITVDITGEPAPGYRVLSVNVDPTSVLVRGRPTQLNLLTQLRTETIDITGLTETFVAPVTLALPDGVALDTITEITVTVEIEPFMSTRTFEKEVQVQGLDEGLTAVVTPENVRVILFGPAPALDVLSENEVQTSVDLFGLEPGEYDSLQPTVTFPDRGLELRSIQPTVVNVTITDSVTTTKTLTDSLRTTDTDSRTVDLETAVSSAPTQPTETAAQTAVSLPINPIHLRALPRQKLSL